MTPSPMPAGRVAVYFFALGMSACANRGMQAPEDLLDAGWPANSRPGTSADAGRLTSGSGGSGVLGSSGGTAGRGGTSGGTGGTVVGSGGGVGTGGVIGSGGVVGTGGVVGSGGVIGTGGTPATGGAAGNTAHVCPAGGVLDCSSAGALRLANGHVTDFSEADWNSATGQLCGAGGLRSRLFSFGGPGASTGAAAVDPIAQNLKLNVTTNSWAGGGVIFESCVDATAFTAIQFTASLSAGSLSGCTWQVQLQTQDQRASTDTDPTGGTCTSNCYAYPLAGLSPAGTTPATYTKAFTLFNNPSGSAIPTNTQVVGLQWQVTAASPQGCTAELRIDDITFR